MTFKRLPNMLLILLVVLAASVTRSNGLLACQVVFDIAPEARTHASLEAWRHFAIKAIHTANRELLLHHSKLLLSFHSVQASSIGIYSTPSQTLASYAASRPAVACVHLLVSNRRFDTGVIGLAYVDGRCSLTRSFAAIFDAFKSHSRQTILHEVLHVIGASHTEDDATSVLAPFLSYNMALTDVADWTPAVNMTPQGCEIDIGNPRYKICLMRWYSSLSAFILFFRLRSDTSVWIAVMSVLITAVLCLLVRMLKWRV